MTFYTTLIEELNTSIPTMRQHVPSGNQHLRPSRSHYSLVKYEGWWRLVEMTGGRWSRDSCWGRDRRGGGAGDDRGWINSASVCVWQGQ